ncbi:hydroxyacid dehydrogenase [Alkalilimnicola ehrlichii]|uniref:Hydroxyacid dehydrogenase n=1 Tax=Alkalilimnicola ehrlichii TaxID=351052 RepID=A0A3E0WI49_9GAMM|nr:D-2-hydroxyacid dehydrogenase [Alkalilimnicola ehrlichii]RFA27241.1 hydroxyacid dehydrogenase [Alkalilimnicola ehrlichii]RFA31545.1 hydroxyacid dehydrogenase [Alkalilimnicola ehrlichii]
MSTNRQGGTERTRIAVLHAEDEGPPPGLDSLLGTAELMFASDQATLNAILDTAEVLMVTDFRTNLVERAWPYAKRLRWIHATSAGVDRLLFPALRNSDIPITNARGIFDRPIAEYVLGLILMYCKDFHGSLALKTKCRWQHRDTERAEGKRVLIVGAGAIGRQIARLTGALGLHTTGIASRARAEDPDFDSVRGSDELLDELPKADFVVVAAPLTEATQGLFDTAAFNAMQPSARFINIGRGAIVKTDALVKALQEGRIAGAALDVFEQEPLPADHPLWAMPEVFVSAHMAGDVVGWREALSAQFVENFERWRRGEPLANQVDKQRGYVPQA